MNPFDFFVRKICLTTGGPEWQKAAAEFQRVSLYGVERFNALPAIGPHQSFNLGVKAILQDFYDSGAHSLLFLEDDVQFRNMDYLWPALQELPSDWDVFYMGCNIQGEAIRVSERIYRVSNAWTTHAVAYTRPIVRFILDNQPGESEQMFDNWLGGQLPNWNAYVMKPMCAVQRPRRSSIWNAHTDYTEVFRQSEGKCV
jgi:hypothetical protein